MNEEAFERRKKALHKLLTLNAPSEILFFSARTFLQSKYKSDYRFAWAIFWDRLCLDIEYCKALIQVKYYSLYMSKEQAVEKVFGSSATNVEEK